MNDWAGWQAHRLTFRWPRFGPKLDGALNLRSFTASMNGIEKFVSIFFAAATAVVVTTHTEELPHFLLPVSFGMLVLNGLFSQFIIHCHEKLANTIGLLFFFTSNRWRKVHYNLKVMDFKIILILCINDWTAADCQHCLVGFLCFSALSFAVRKAYKTYN